MREYLVAVLVLVCTFQSCYCDDRGYAYPKPKVAFVSGHTAKAETGIVVYHPKSQEPQPSAGPKGYTYSVPVQQQQPQHYQQQQQGYYYGNPTQHIHPVPVQQVYQPTVQHHVPQQQQQYYQAPVQQQYYQMPVVLPQTAHAPYFYPIPKVQPVQYTQPTVQYQTYQPVVQTHATPSIQPQTSQGYHYPAPAVRFVSPQPQATIQKLVPSQGYQYPVPHVPFTTSPQQPKTASGYQYPVPNVPFVNPEPRPTAAQSQGYVYPVPSVPLITPSQSRTTTGYQYPVPQIPLVTPPQQPKTTSGYQYPVPSVPFVIPQPRPTAASSQGYAYPVPQVPLVTTPQQPKTSSGYQYPVPSVPLPVPERKPVHLPTVVEPTIVATPALTAAPTLIHKAPVEDLSSRVDLRFGVIEKSGSNLVIEKHQSVSSGGYQYPKPQQPLLH